ncbi:MAG: LacI family DNA-binding transcriptional regulator [Ignavibacteriaceae bacterium]
MIHITQLDIAKKLNVTRITVSKALRNHPDISTKMKKKVLDTAEELGYIPNLIAQNLTSHRSFTLGVVIPDLENSFFAYATDSIIDTAGGKDYNVFVTVSREDQQSEKLNIQKLIGMRVDGLLICVSQQTKQPQIFNHVKKLNIPLVFFDRQFEGLEFPSVTYNDREGAVTALNKILEEGYTRIAHFAGYSSVSIGKERCLGYKDALAGKGILIKPEWIIEGGFEVIDGYYAFMELYNSKNLPEIIFTVNDQVALGVYKAASEKGLKIPEDIGVAGFGFKDTANTFTPPLSVINQDPRKIGSAAAEFLIEIITNPGVKMERNIIIDEEFIWNNSIIKK